MKKVNTIFNTIVKQLNEQKIYPIIYGSLGLYLKTGWSGKINDIDFIIHKPKEFAVCKKVLLKNGFQIDPDHNRELIKNDFYTSFIDKKDIEKLISEQLKLTTECFNENLFFNIDIKQYSKIYTNGLKNKYRKERKEKDDSEKIKFIVDYLKNKK
jgi:hypothetical protein